ncbi:MAG: hypothetical protein QNL91_10025 [Candidatus Krumholzibacteria bacterium]|nr:hypothetical protein [Candidatus Krumholzibacteria bacterium]
MGDPKRYTLRMAVSGVKPAELAFELGDDVRNWDISPGRQVSTTSGAWQYWLDDGKTLIFQDGDGGRIGNTKPRLTLQTRH